MFPALAERFATMNLFKESKLNRKQYIVIIIPYLVIFYLAVLLILSVPDLDFPPILGFIGLFFFIGLIYINSKRMNDCGRSKAEFIFYLIPLYFMAHTILLMFIKSKNDAVSQ